MKILLFFSSGLGDALFLAPTYFALRELYPSSHITAMVPQQKHNRYLLQEIFRFEEVIQLKRPRSLSPLSLISYLKYFYELSKNIRKEKFDIVIPTVEVCLPDQYLLTLISGAKHRIGPKHWRRQKNIFRFVLTNQIQTPVYGHIIDFHFNIVRAIDPKLEVQKYLTKTTDILMKSAEPSNFKPVTNKLLIILPGSGTQPYKRWALRNFTEVISKVLEDYNCDIVIISGSQEYDAALIPPKVSENPRFHNLADTLTLPQVIHLFLQANLIIANDNGLLHLAEFLNKPTIGIYPGNWTHVSKRFFDNDTKHIVLPENQKDLLAEKLMDNIRRTAKIQELCKHVVNSVTVNDVLSKINNNTFLK